jgi:6,7-dimethyl-8-ribityllumazine synthase
MEKIRVAIVVSEFNSSITFQMLDKAKDQVKKVNADIRYVCYVPGSFDMPLMLDELLKKKDVDAVVLLGAIVKGETQHDQVIAETVAKLIAQLSLKYSKPVGFGIAGPGMTIEQAKNRIEIVPVRTVNAAVNMAIRIKKLTEEKPSLEKKVTIID